MILIILVWMIAVHLLLMDGLMRQVAKITWCEIAHFVVVGSCWFYDSNQSMFNADF